MMKLRAALLVATWHLAGCQSPRQADQEAVQYPMIDYVEVGKKLDSVEPPYVIDLENGPKHLVFIGNDHNNDTTHRQYAIIEKRFNLLRPQVAFNEGGQIPGSEKYATPAAAILRRGNTGFLKYLCDRAGIRMINGDTDEKTEFAITLKKYPKDKLFLYYVMERLVIPYLAGAHRTMSFEELYVKAVDKWFVSQGYPLGDDERDLAYFKKLYLQYMGTPFVLELNENIEKFDYINGGDCEFCAIGRTSKVVRDSILLGKVDQALNQYDRVLVTFGHGHALAVEPALRKIINKPR